MIPQNSRQYLLGIAKHSITWDISGILLNICSCWTIIMCSFVSSFFSLRQDLRIVHYHQTIFLFCNKILTHGLISFIKKDHRYWS